MANLLLTPTVEGLTNFFMVFWIVLDPLYAFFSSRQDGDEEMMKYSIRD